MCCRSLGVVAFQGGMLGRQVAVGVGTLAGSTVMLLTIAWGGAIVVGRCDLDAQVRPPHGLLACPATPPQPAHPASFVSFTISRPTHHTLLIKHPG